MSKRAHSFNISYMRNHLGRSLAPVGPKSKDINSLFILSAVLRHWNQQPSTLAHTELSANAGLSFLLFARGWACWKHQVSKALENVPIDSNSNGSPNVNNHIAKFHPSSHQVISAKSMKSRWRVPLLSSDHGLSPWGPCSTAKTLTPPRGGEWQSEDTYTIGMVNQLNAQRCLLPKLDMDPLRTSCPKATCLPIRIGPICRVHTEL